MNFNYINLTTELFPEENRLIRQAKSGNTNAFIQLYDAYVERVYRYVHFLVPNNRIAEGLTFQVFFKAWEHLERYRIFNSSFVVWLYSTARDQVIYYHGTHKKTAVLESDFILAVRGGDLWEEFQAIRAGLQFLTVEQQHVLILKFIVDLSNKDISRVMKKRQGDAGVLQMQALQALTEYLDETELRFNEKSLQRIIEECLMSLSSGASTLDECLARYPEHDSQLKPLLETVLLLNLGRDAKPSPTFRAYTHDALNQYMRSHPRQTQVVMPMFQRAALTFAMLVAVLLVTGTAHAQSALPGESFYTWKRTSEQAWRVISPNPVATDVILAERRLNEWMAVSDDPQRSAGAKANYLQALTRLESTNDSDVKTLTLIAPMLQLQQQTLDDAGLSTPELNDLVVVVDNLLVNALAQVTPTVIAPSATRTPTRVVPTATAVPTEVVPTATGISTATESPTATGTSTATETPTATDTPTEVPPTETEVPTEVPPTETEVPTEVPPTEEPTPEPTLEEIP